MTTAPAPWATAGELAARFNVHADTVRARAGPGAAPTTVLDAFAALRARS